MQYAKISLKFVADCHTKIGAKAQTICVINSTMRVEAASLFCVVFDVFWPCATARQIMCTVKPAAHQMAAGINPVDMAMPRVNNPSCTTSQYCAVEGILIALLGLFFAIFPMVWLFATIFRPFSRHPTFRLLRVIVYAYPINIFLIFKAKEIRINRV